MKKHIERFDIGINNAIDAISGLMEYVNLSAVHNHNGPAHFYFIGCLDGMKLINTIDIGDLSYQNKILRLIISIYEFRDESTSGLLSKNSIVDRLRYITHEIQEIKTSFYNKIESINKNNA